MKTKRYHTDCIDIFSVVETEINDILQDGWLQSTTEISAQDIHTDCVGSISYPKIEHLTYATSEIRVLSWVHSIGHSIEVAVNNGNNCPSFTVEIRVQSLYNNQPSVTRIYTTSTCNDEELYDFINKFVGE